MKIGHPLQQAMKQLGMAAVMQTAKLTKLGARPPDLDVREFKAVHEELDDLIRTAITYTAKLIHACSDASPRDLEAYIFARMDGPLEGSSDFQQSVNNLVLAARNYTNRMTELVEHCKKAGVSPVNVRVDGHEHTYKLACAAVAFTMQLSIVCHPDPAAACASAQELEQRLIATLDEAFAPPKDLS